MRWNQEKVAGANAARAWRLVGSAGVAICAILAGVGRPVGAEAGAAAPAAVAAASVTVAASPSAVAAAPADSPEILGWETIPLDGATCGRGDPFKYFLNPSDDDAAGLFLFLMGGGACLKEGPAPPGAEGVAAQLYCMEFSNFTEPTDAYHLIGGVVPFLNRLAVDNPYGNYHYVVIPYCTGDVHVGGAIEAHDYDPSEAGEFPVVHRGRLNVLAVLDDLKVRLPEDRHVVLTGSSAGGFGAIYNFPEVIARWPSTVLLPDAGIAPPAESSLMARYGEEVAARWRAEEALPDYCNTPDCTADTMRLLAAHADRYDGVHGPWRPFGYLQAQQDGTLSEYLEISRCTYELGLKIGHATTTRPNLRGYLPATAQHTFLPSNGFESAVGIQAFEWFAAVAGAQSEAELPADAIDPWIPCNQIVLTGLFVP